MYYITIMTFMIFMVTENLLGFLDCVDVVFTLQDAAFGKSWVHSVRAALELDFGIEDSGDIGQEGLICPTGFSQCNIICIRQILLDALAKNRLIDATNSSPDVGCFQMTF